MKEINLLDKLIAAHEQIHPRFNPRAADLVFAALGPDGQAAWKRANLPIALIVRSPEAAQSYAIACGIDLTNI